MCLLLPRVPEGVHSLERWQNDEEVAEEAEGSYTGQAEERLHELCGQGTRRNSGGMSRFCGFQPYNRKYTGLPFFKVVYVFICFNGFLHGFNGFNWFKLLFEPIRLELDQFSAQMVDSRPESWHFWKLPNGLLGWVTTLRELKVPSGIAPLKKNIFFKPPNCSRVSAFKCLFGS